MKKILVLFTVCLLLVASSSWAQTRPYFIAADSIRFSNFAGTGTKFAIEGDVFFKKFPASPDSVFAVGPGGKLIRVAAGLGSITQQQLDDSANAIRQDFPVVTITGKVDTAYALNDSTLHFQRDDASWDIGLTSPPGGGGSTDTTHLRNDINTNTAAIATKQNLITLTTTGTSGASTFNQGTGALNIPNYAGGGGSGWGLTGNSITAGTDYLGTTNNTSLRIRTNGVERFSIDSTKGIILGRQMALGGLFNTVINRNTDYIVNNRKPYALEVIGIDSAFLAGDSSASGQFAVTVYENTSGGNSIHSRKARGTQLVPLGIPAGDRLLSIGGKGYMSNVPAFSNSAVAIIGTATEDFTSTANGAKLEFRVTANGTFAAQNPAYALTLNSDNSATFAGAITTTAVSATSSLGTPKLLVGTGSTTHKQEINGTLTDLINAFRINVTMPSTSSTVNYAANILATSVTSTQPQSALNVELIAGATNASSFYTGRFINAVAGTGSPVMTWTGGGNNGIISLASGTTTGINIGVSSDARNAIINFGLHGVAVTNKNSGTNIGVVGLGLNAGTSPIQIGGYFGLHTTTPTFVSSALLADNGATTSPIFIARDGGVNVFSITDGGGITQAATNTAGGTTGAQTINKAAGSVNVAAAGTTLVVTNSLVTANSLVFLQVYGTDATATSARVTVAAGSFTITLNAAATAETKVAFHVIN